MQVGLARAMFIPRLNPWVFLKAIIMKKYPCLRGVECERGEFKMLWELLFLYTNAIVNCFVGSLFEFTFFSFLLSSLLLAFFSQWIQSICECIREVD